MRNLFTRTEGAQGELMGTTEYLKRRGQTWFVRVQIPAHLWKAAGGKREFVKTLKTGDLVEANRRNQEADDKGKAPSPFGDG